jgi:hypothetical protein
VPAAWVTADEAYGGDPVLRGWLEDRKVSYFLAVRCTDPEALPVVEHGFLTDRDGHDVSVLVDGVRLARRLAGTKALSGLCEGELAPGPDLGDGELRAYVRRWVRALASGRYLQDGAGDRRGRGG